MMGLLFQALWPLVRSSCISAAHSAGAPNTQHCKEHIALHKEIPEYTSALALKM